MPRSLGPGSAPALRAMIWRVIVGDALTIATITRMQPCRDSLIPLLTPIEGAPTARGCMVITNLSGIFLE